jgi:tRNA A37 methylthiotransferase MiaB
MPGQVAASIAHERSLTLREIASRKRHAFMESFVGARLSAITFRDSNQPDTEWTEALTDNYLKLRLKGRHPGNRWLASRILGISEDSQPGSSATLVGTVTVSD